MTGPAEKQLVQYSNFVSDSSRWQGFVLRPDDIIISTPPKCGTTWTQMITALLIYQTPNLPAPLAELSPWLDMRTRARRDVVADLEASAQRRFIKTHTPMPGLPYADGVTYICVGRDPRDVALSMDDHMANLDFGALLVAYGEAAAIDGTPAPTPPPPPPEGLDQGTQAKFWRWVLDDTPPTASGSSLLGTLDHVSSFWHLRDSENVVMVHYHDLKTDLEGQMRNIAGRLGIDVPVDRWPELVAAASFDEMRRRSPMTTPNSDSAIWLDNANFFRKGRSGAWREVLNNEEDLRRYDDRVTKLASPEVAGWMHRS